MSDTTTFTELGVEASLADALASAGIHTPFPIQELTLPMALKGADLIGQARTGTGKTLAFGLPLLQKIDPGLKKTQALVIVPTRELCLQVAADLTVGAERDVTSIAIYGGVGYEEQIDALRGGVHVVIGTPGRTLDHLGRGNLDLDNVHVVVLDEADEMLDMGFLPDVERLLTGVPEQRQTLLFSATIPAEIVKLARRFMSQPTFMRAESEEPDTSPTVDQHFFLVHRMDKPRVLARILQTDSRGGAFVFTRTKNMADRLVRELDDLHVRAIAVHGDLRQQTREKNLDRFRAGRADVLVATEVAARGLDVDNVSHVVNYDCPDDEKMYLHRIGRTARAGNRGVAVTFAEFNEIDRLNVIRKAVGAEDEIAEVFSTSDLLAERFDLPEQTPWDHLARGGNGSSGSSGSGSGGSSTDRRRSSTQGRNQSRRGSDGSRPASRERSRDDRSGASSAGAGGATSAPASSSNGRVRTRTRTRTRSTDRTDRQASPDSGEGRAREATTDRADGTGSGGERRRSSGRSGRGRSRGGSSSKRGGSGGSDARARDAKGSKGPGTSKGSKGARGGKGKGGTPSGGDEQGGSGGSRTAGGGSSPARPARRGEPARGEGTPRPRRRVRVDHLP